MKQAAFFLGANAGGGFVSFFEACMAESRERESWLIKGGPGCGKSTLMKTLSGRLGAEELFYCSSDPDSLDGVLLPGDQLVLDATAPHILDVPLHGACGGYLVTPPPRDRAALRCKLKNLQGLKARAAVCWSGAYRLLGAAALAEAQLRALVSPHLPQQRLRRRAKGIADRELPDKKSPGQLKKRFLEGYTPAGLRTLWDTVEVMADRVYDLQDDWGIGEPMLQQLLESALNRGHTVWACYSPLEPDRLRHLLIPGLRLAFVTSDSRGQYPGKPWRRLRLEAYLGDSRYKALRRQLKDLRRQISALEQGALDYLRMAHHLHDQIEGLFRPHLDTEAMEHMADRLTQQLK